VARKKPEKQTERTRLYVSPRAHLVTKLRVAAAALGLSETEMVERLIIDNLSSVYARLPDKYAGEVQADFNENGKSGPGRAGVALPGGAPPIPPTTTVKISQQISGVDANSKRFVDGAVDELGGG